jgi:hypothetical protein
LPDRPAHAEEELGLLLALGPALMSTRTSAAPETEEVYGRARQLARDTDKVTELFATLWGLSAIAINRGNREVSLASTTELFSIARKQNDAGYLLQAHHSSWSAEHSIGNFPGGARRSLWPPPEAAKPSVTTPTEASTIRKKRLENPTVAVAKRYPRLAATKSPSIPCQKTQSDRLLAHAAARRLRGEYQRALSSNTLKRQGP